MGVLTSLSVAFYVKVTDPQGKMNVVKDWKLNWVKGARWNGGRYVLSLTNTGNVHLVSEGKLKIHDWLNNQTVEEPLLYTNFLPGVTKELVVEWEKPKRGDELRNKKPSPGEAVGSPLNKNKEVEGKDSADRLTGAGVLGGFLSNLFVGAKPFCWNVPNRDASLLVRLAPTSRLPRWSVVLA